MMRLLTALATWAVPTAPVWTMSFEKEASTRRRRPAAAGAPRAEAEERALVGSLAAATHRRVGHMEILFQTFRSQGLHGPRMDRAQHRVDRARPRRRSELRIPEQ